MKLYRYWALAEKKIVAAEDIPLHLKKWGGSNSSFDDALAAARTKLDDLAARLGQSANHLDWYAYAGRDLPEELIELMNDEAGITRNRLGMAVLNTAKVCMVDVDFRKPNFFARLFGKKAMDEAAHIAHLQNWLAGRPNTGVRAYRTAAGLRYIFTHNLCAVNEKSINIMQQLHADRLYVKLCKAQNSYRARLTPKPWRLGYQGLHGFAYPRDAEEEKYFRDWLAEYEEKSRPYAVCRLLGQFGNGEIHPDIAPIIKLHDQRTRAEEGLPLA